MHNLHITENFLIMCTFYTQTLDFIIVFRIFAAPFIRGVKECKCLNINLIKASNYAQFLSNTNISLKVETKHSLLSSTRAIQSVSHKALLESIHHF